MNETDAERNKYDVIDEDSLSLMETIVVCGLVNSIAVFGIAGNVLNVIILSIHGLRDSTNVIFMSLSLVDLVYDVLLPLRRIRCVINRFDDVMAQNIDVAMTVYLVVPLRVVSFLSSGHIMLISLERTVAVYFPLVVSRIFTVRTTLIFLASLYFFWIAMSGPFYGMFSIVWVSDVTTKEYFKMFVFSEYFVKNIDVFSFINSFIVANIRGPISLLCIILASIATGIKLREANRRRLKMSTSKIKVSYDVKAVRMLLTVTLVYLGFALPASVPTYLYYIDDSFVLFHGRTTNIYTAMESLVDLLYVMNSSVNFLIYVSMSRKFSNTYFMLMGRCVIRKVK